MTVWLIEVYVTRSLPYLKKNAFLIKNCMIIPWTIILLGLLEPQRNLIITATVHFWICLISLVNRRKRAKIMIALVKRVILSSKRRKKYQHPLYRDKHFAMITRYRWLSLCVCTSLLKKLLNFSSPLNTTRKLYIKAFNEKIISPRYDDYLAFEALRTEIWIHFYKKMNYSIWRHPYYY